MAKFGIINGKVWRYLWLNLASLRRLLFQTKAKFGIIYGWVKISFMPSHYSITSHERSKYSYTGLGDFFWLKFDFSRFNF